MNKLELTSNIINIAKKAAFVAGIVLIGVTVKKNLAASKEETTEIELDIIEEVEAEV